MGWWFFKVFAYVTLSNLPVFAIQQLFSTMYLKITWILFLLKLQCFFYQLQKNRNINIVISCHLNMKNFTWFVTFLVLWLEQWLGPLAGHVPDIPVEAGQPQVVKPFDIVGGDEADLPRGVLHLPPVVLRVVQHDVLLTLHCNKNISDTGTGIEQLTGSELLWIRIRIHFFINKIRKMQGNW